MDSVQSASAGTCRSHPEHQHDAVSCSWSINSGFWSSQGTAIAIAGNMTSLRLSQTIQLTQCPFCWELYSFEEDFLSKRLWWGLPTLWHYPTGCETVVLVIVSHSRNGHEHGEPSQGQLYNVFLLPISLFICKPLTQAPNSWHHLLGSSLLNDASAHTDQALTSWPGWQLHTSVTIFHQPIIHRKYFMPQRSALPCKPQKPMPTNPQHTLRPFRAIWAVCNENVCQVYSGVNSTVFCQDCFRKRGGIVQAQCIAYFSFVVPISYSFTPPFLLLSTVFLPHTEMS